MVIFLDCNILFFYFSQGWTKTNAFHVCITSYKLVVQDHQAFRRKKWKYFILDEVCSLCFTSFNHSCVGFGIKGLISVYQDVFHLLVYFSSICSVCLFVTSIATLRVGVKLIVSLRCSDFTDHSELLGWDRVHKKIVGFLLPSFLWWVTSSVFMYVSFIQIRTSVLGMEERGKERKIESEQRKVFETMVLFLWNGLLIYQKL